MSNGEGGAKNETKRLRDYRCEGKKFEGGKV
jgi:hypothetical protein